MLSLSYPQGTISNRCYGLHPYFGCRMGTWGTRSKWRTTMTCNSGSKCDVYNNKAIYRACRQRTWHLCSQITLTTNRICVKRIELWQKNQVSRKLCCTAVCIVINMYTGQKTNEQTVLYVGDPDIKLTAPELQMKSFITFHFEKD